MLIKNIIINIKIQKGIKDMILNSMQNTQKERAKFAREIDYLRETALDDMIDERMEVLESSMSNLSLDSEEELKEAAEYVDRLEIDDEVAIEEAEVNRILNATDNLTFMEMVGVTDIEDE